jgi:hypothetical protein
MTRGFFSKTYLSTAVAINPVGVVAVRYAPFGLPSGQRFIARAVSASAVPLGLAQMGFKHIH